MFMGGLGHQRHHMPASCRHFSFKTHILSACPTQRRRLILIDAGKCVIEQTASHDANPRNILCCRRNPLRNLFMSFRITSYVLGSFVLEIKEPMYQKPSIIFSKPVQSENKNEFQNPEKCHNQTIAASERKCGSLVRRIKQRAKQADWSEKLRVQGDPG